MLLCLALALPLLGGTRASLPALHPAFPPVLASSTDSHPLPIHSMSAQHALRGAVRRVPPSLCRARHHSPAFLSSPRSLCSSALSMSHKCQTRPARPALPAPLSSAWSALLHTSSAHRASAKEDKASSLEPVVEPGKVLSEVRHKGRGEKGRPLTGVATVQATAPVRGHTNGAQCAYDVATSQHSSAGLSDSDR